MRCIQRRQLPTAFLRAFSYSAAFHPQEAPKDPFLEDKSKIYFTETPKFKTYAEAKEYYLNPKPKPWDRFYDAKVSPMLFPLPAYYTPVRPAIENPLLYVPALLIFDVLIEFLRDTTTRSSSPKRIALFKEVWEYYMKVYPDWKFERVAPVVAEIYERHAYWETHVDFLFYKRGALSMAQKMFWTREADWDELFVMTPEETLEFHSLKDKFKKHCEKSDLPISEKILKFGEKLQFSADILKVNNEEKVKVEKSFEEIGKLMLAVQEQELKGVTSDTFDWENQLKDIVKRNLNIRLTAHRRIDAIIHILKTKMNTFRDAKVRASAVIQQLEEIRLSVKETADFNEVSQVLLDVILNPIAGMPASEFIAELRQRIQHRESQGRLVIKSGDISALMYDLEGIDASHGSLPAHKIVCKLRELLYYYGVIDGATNLATDVFNLMNDPKSDFYNMKEKERVSAAESIDKNHIHPRLLKQEEQEAYNQYEFRRALISLLQHKDVYVTHKEAGTWLNDPLSLLSDLKRVRSLLQDAQIPISMESENPFSRYLARCAMGIYAMGGKHQNGVIPLQQDDLDEAFADLDEYLSTPRDKRPNVPPTFLPLTPTDAKQLERMRLHRRLNDLRVAGESLYTQREKLLVDGIEKFDVSQSQWKDWKGTIGLPWDVKSLPSNKENGESPANMQLKLRQYEELSKQPPSEFGAWDMEGEGIYQKRFQSEASGDTVKDVIDETEPWENDEIDEMDISEIQVDETLSKGEIAEKQEEFPWGVKLSDVSVKLERGEMKISGDSDPELSDAKVMNDEKDALKILKKVGEEKSKSGIINIPLEVEIENDEREESWMVIDEIREDIWRAHVNDPEKMDVFALAHRFNIRAERIDTILRVKEHEKRLGLVFEPFEVIKDRDGYFWGFDYQKYMEAQFAPKRGKNYDPVGVNDQGEPITTIYERGRPVLYKDYKQKFSMLSKREPVDGAGSSRTIESKEESESKGQLKHRFPLLISDESTVKHDGEFKATVRERDGSSRHINEKELSEMKRLHHPKSHRLRKKLYLNHHVKDVRAIMKERVRLRKEEVEKERSKIEDLWNKE